MSISVALAARDGEEYLVCQLASILSQLDKNQGDELVISVDPSSDATVKLVERIAGENPVVKQLVGPGRGINANFEHALKSCTGDYIFLSDQDDIWKPDKVRRVKEIFDTSEVALILHDAEVIDNDLNVLQYSYFETRKSRQGIWSNIVKNSYMGCCMAFKRELLDVALPFPSQIPMYDQWLGLLAEKHMSVRFLPLQLIQYRRHNKNSTSDKHASSLQMLAWRYSLLCALQERDRELM